MNLKDNVLIFIHTPGKHGVTTAAFNLLRALDTARRNYTVCYFAHQWSAEQVDTIPPGFSRLPLDPLRYGITEAAALFLSYRCKFSAKLVENKLRRLFRREYKRYFGGMSFSAVVHFEGYGKTMIRLLCEADTRRVIFVHNNMLTELAKKRPHVNRAAVTLAYREYDVIAPASAALVPAVLALGGTAEKIRPVANLNDTETILRRAAEPLRFDEGTACTVTQAELQAVLDGNGPKFLTIGRFSDEKGHDLLIAAFERFHRNHPDAALIIIGGFGPLYEQTLALRRSSPARDRIIIILALDNPMPVLRQCDLFVLPSHYEALGIVLLEADTLGRPILCTDVPGSGDFVKAHGGPVYPLSRDGLLAGMEDFLAGKITPLGVDYKACNQAALQQFEALLT